MANILGVDAFHDGARPRAWWEWSLIAVLCASALVGIIAFFWTSCKAIRRLFKVRFHCAADGAHHLP